MELVAIFIVSLIILGFLGSVSGGSRPHHPENWKYGEGGALTKKTKWWIYSIKWPDIDEPEIMEFERKTALSTIRGLARKSRGFNRLPSGTTVKLERTEMR